MNCFVNKLTIFYFFPGVVQFKELFQSNCCLLTKNRQTKMFLVVCLSTVTKFNKESVGKSNLVSARAKCQSILYGQTLVVSQIGSFSRSARYQMAHVVIAINGFYFTNCQGEIFVFPNRHTHTLFVPFVSKDFSFWLILYYPLPVY